MTNKFVNMSMYQSLKFEHILSITKLY